MASIRRNPRSPYWIAIFRLPDGKQTNRSTKVLASEANRKKALALAEAYEAAYRDTRTATQLQAIMDDVSRRVLGTVTSSPPVGDYLTAWLGRVTEEVSPRTAAKYRGTVAAFTRWAGEIRLADVRRETMTDYRAHLASRKATATANNAIKILRGAFKDAIRDGLISDNPADIRPLKSRGDTVAKEPFTERELSALWKAAETLPEWRGMLMLGLYTGQRIRDLATLRWEHVDLEKSEIRLTTGKTRRRQLILMAPPLRDWLLANLSPGDDPTAMLFPAFAPVLQHTASGWLSNRFRRDVMGPAGVGAAVAGQRVNPKSFHSLRHTLPSLLAETGVSQTTIAEIVGHDSMALSWHYTHVSRDEVQRAIGGLRNPFSG